VKQRLANSDVKQGSKSSTFIHTYLHIVEATSAVQHFPDRPADCAVEQGLLRRNSRGDTSVAVRMMRMPVTCVCIFVDCVQRRQAWVPACQQVEIFANLLGDARLSKPSSKLYRNIFPHL
jgi:hypothetical protein